VEPGVRTEVAPGAGTELGTEIAVGTEMAVGAEMGLGGVAAALPAVLSDVECAAVG
jgi:glycine cleavage system pyridoxal-binding protein P